MSSIYNKFLQYSKWGAGKFTDLFGLPFVNEGKDDGLKWHLQEIRAKTGEAINELEIEVEGLKENKISKTNGIETPNGKTIGMPSNTDLDELNKTGFYNIYNPSGRPDKSSEWGYVEVLEKDPGTSGKTGTRQTLTELGGTFGTGIDGQPRQWFRVKADDSWKPWQEILTENNGVLTPNGNIKYLHGINLDTENIKTGPYFAVDCPMRPFGENGYLSIERSPDNSYSKQTYTRHMTGETWIRNKNGGLWNDWKKVIISDWKPLPLASGMSTDTGANQAVYCDCGHFYMFSGIVRGDIKNGTRLWSLVHGGYGISATGVVSDSPSAGSNYISANGVYATSSSAITTWVYINGTALK